MFEATMMIDNVLYNEQHCNAPVACGTVLHAMAFLPSVGFLLWLQEMSDS